MALCAYNLSAHIWLYLRCVRFVGTDEMSASAGEQKAADYAKKNLAFKLQVVCCNLNKLNDDENISNVICVFLYSYETVFPNL